MTDPIYEGYATPNIENMEYCNHSLFCLNMPLFLPMLWAVETGASTSGVKLAGNVSFCEKDVHVNHFLVFPLTGRIVPAGIFLYGQLLYPIQAA